jgi:hypothetical protein
MYMKKTTVITRKTNQKTAVKKTSRKSSSSAKGTRSSVKKRTIQYVLPLGNGWVVKTNTSAVFFAITDSKREAVSIARNLARTKHSDLVVHEKNGTISIKESYA